MVPSIRNMKKSFSSSALNPRANDERQMMMQSNPPFGRSIESISTLHLRDSRAYRSVNTGIPLSDQCTSRDRYAGDGGLKRTELNLEANRGTRSV
ncbi:hypothetical protein TNCV_1793931 [Trichonephila clavipes]|nr:hypothetical protein TNCV_1793931 [Trichonephila clavipes]